MAETPRDGKWHGSSAPLSMPQEGKSAWLITFTDTMALMLTFFVLLFAMSEPEPEYWTDMATALQKELRPFYVELRDSGPINTINLDRVEYNRALDTRYLQSILLDLLADDPALSRVIVTQIKEAVVLSFTGDLIFDKGQAGMTEAQKEVFTKLARFLGQIRNRVIVHGHSDPDPVTGQNFYQSNWGLSLLRAAEMAQLLKDSGYNKPLQIRGYGDGQFYALSENMGQDQRYALSRRVDILILDDNGTVFDPL